jgi:small subunit ribosomal protein S6
MFAASGGGFGREKRLGPSPRRRATPAIAAPIQASALHVILGMSRISHPPTTPPFGNAPRGRLWAAAIFARRLAVTKTPEYELVLMLDPEAPDERRERIVADARTRIEGAGTLKHDSAWGMRKLAFEIRQRTEADYRFFRFQSEPPLLESLDHELKIADGVLRFRIFQVDPRAPMIVPPAPAATSAARASRRAAEAPRPPTPEPPAQAPAEGEAEPAAEQPPPEPAAEASEAAGSDAHAAGPEGSS